ncbi:MAG: NAD(P)H-dependent oxidoreductase [Nitrospirae bacterium]|nr:NAD(P)H-dependent oxidoreductase [Candidatus Manganitrophaceae bacterium]
MKILAFAASLRQGSYNRKLIKEAAALLRFHSDLVLDHADYREFEMPIFDGDLEERSGIPAGGREFIRRIQGADGLVIATPEYNGGIPGTLKNAIDWSSRNDPDPLEGKPVLLLGTSPGRFGAVRGLWHTRVPFEAIGAYVYPEVFALPLAREAFDPSDRFIDPKNRDRLGALLTAYLQYVGSLSRRIDR